jgi:hypothetical protein
MATRRGVMQAGIGGALFGVGGGAKALFNNALNLPPPTHCPPSYAGDACKQTADVARPLMEHSSALRRVLGDAFLRAQVRAQIYEELRYSSEIDPDIAILKSLSPMAKIAFTRRRRVERQLKEAFTFNFDQPQPYSHARELVSRHIQSLMWGKA